MGKGRDAEVAIGAIACCACVAVIVTVSLVAASFESVDEADYCLRYNKHTRVVEEEVYQEAGSFYVGLWDSFICFPKQIVNIEFSQNPDADRGRMSARSREGLVIDMDVNVEFRLLPEHLYELFMEVGVYFKDTFVRIARSELRNTAAEWPALQFLGPERGNISLAMKENLSRAFLERHVSALSVQLRRVYLPDVYDAAIKRVEESKLEAKKAEQERDVALAEEDRSNVTSVILLLAEREAILLTERTNIVKARLEQEAELTNEQVRADLLMLEAETNRSNILLEASAEIDKAISRREGTLTKERAEQDKLVIQFGTQISEVEAEAEIIEIAANATAEAIIAEQVALVAAFEAEKAAERDALVALTTARPDMNATAVLQYKWFETLSSLKDSLFTLDYKKVPFFLEAQSGSSRRSATVGDNAVEAAVVQEMAGVYDYGLTGEAAN